MDKKRKPHGQRTSSLLLRLNTRLFFRLLGIYLGMDLLLVLLCGAWLFWRSEHQCAEISALVEERGVPAADATEWMRTGDAVVTAGGTAGGWRLPDWLPALPETAGGIRYFEPGPIGRLFGAGGNRQARYTLFMPNGGEPYTVALDLSAPARFFWFAARILLICQLISLISNLFKNAGAIRRTLRPIQELSAVVAQLGGAQAAPPEGLKSLAGTLDQINATHLDARISVSSTQKELQDLARAINAMLDRVSEAYQSQMRFVSDASHELRTPIAVIQGYASLLNRWGKDDPATRQEAIDAIQSEAGSMKELVEQLLFLARGDNDSMHIEITLFDLTQVAAGVLRETEMIDQTHHFSSRWDCAVPVCGDIGLIKQALRILVDNAVKYTPAGGHIDLSACSADGLARITVQDDGQGIKAEALPYIFDRFYRTDESRTRQTGGAGLGLSIAKWIAERHGGWFEVRSWENAGTQMTMVLPLSGAAAGAPGEKTA